MRALAFGIPFDLMYGVCNFGGSSHNTQVQSVFSKSELNSVKPILWLAEILDFRLVMISIDLLNIGLHMP